MAKAVPYTHKSKGGSYEIVIDGDEHKSIITAGTLKGDGIVLYRSTETNQVYARTRKDFFDSMRLVDENV